MYLETLQCSATDRTVRVLLMGAGEYGLLLRAQAATGANPISFYLMAGHRLLRDVPAGTVIAAEMVAPPQESVLWQLRREMEMVFGLR